jgi:hypothetical protein
MRFFLAASVLVMLAGCGPSGQTSASDENLLHQKLGHPPNGRNRHGAGEKRKATLLNKVDAPAAPSAPSGVTPAAPPTTTPAGG